MANSCQFCDLRLMRCAAETVQEGAPGNACGDYITPFSVFF
jgi:hypothetical protein